MKTTHKILMAETFRLMNVSLLLYFIICQKYLYIIDRQMAQWVIVTCSSRRREFSSPNPHSGTQLYVTSVSGTLTPVLSSSGTEDTQCTYIRASRNANTHKNKNVNSLYFILAFCASCYSCILWFQSFKEQIT